MPPQIVTSDSDSDGDIIAAKATTNDVDVASVASDDAEVAAEAAEAAEDEEEYIVEGIKSHRYEGQVFSLLANSWYDIFLTQMQQLFLLVKWKGYERKSDMTWEPEENCEYAYPLSLFLSLRSSLL